ncbi:MAG: hypothetical protein NVS1B3_07740 [Candidatus Dormibacteraceae bacterium]
MGHESCHREQHGSTHRDARAQNTTGGVLDPSRHLLAGFYPDGPRNTNSRRPVWIADGFIAPRGDRAVKSESEVTLTTYGRKTGQPHDVTIWITTDGARIYLIRAD